MKTIFANLRFLLAVLTGVVAFALPAAAAEVAGHFQFVVGDVQVRSANNAMRPARKGDPVHEGESIVTGATGDAQLRMVDQGFVSVRRDSEIRVEQYSYKGRNDGSESGLLNLVKGTFRSVTGLIARSNKDNFRMKTAVSTIGIRGTEGVAYYDPVTNTALLLTLDGSYVVGSVDREGRIVGTAFTLPGQTFLVEQGKPPVQVPTSEILIKIAATPPPAPSKPGTTSNLEGDPGTNTREGGGTTGTASSGTSTTATMSTSAFGLSTSNDCGPACQQLLQASLEQQIRGLFLQAQAAASGLATLSASTQAAAAAAVTNANTAKTNAATSSTNAGTAATNANAIVAPDIVPLNNKITSAQGLLPFAPQIQPQVNSALAQQTAANTSLTGLTAAQTAAQTAATQAAAAATTAANAATAAATAAAAIPGAVAGPVNTATADFTTVQATFNDALAALAAGEILKAQTLLQTLTTQVATALNSAGAASATASTALAAVTTQQSTAATAAGTAATQETTAAGQFTTATTAANSATTSIAAGIGFADAAINIALGDIQNIQLAANTSSTNATNAVTTITGLQTNVGTVNTNIGAISLVDTTPATTEITAAGTAIGTATTAVNTANALTLAAAQTTATTNSTTAGGLATTAATTVTGATTVYNANSNVANGVGGTDFRDSTAIPAKTAMDAAKTALDTANTQVQTSKTTIDTQVTALADAKTAATTALGSANTALASANTALTTANAENTTITAAKNAVTADLAIVNTQLGIAQTAAGSGATTPDPTPTAANSAVASGCGTAKACFDLTTQYVNAATAAVPGSPEQANASNNALVAQGRASTFETTAINAIAPAQAAATDAAAKLPIAQASATAATTAVNTSVTSAGAGATGAQGLAATATTQATNAQTASTTGTTALGTSNTAAGTVTTNALTVAQQAAIAQYNNPTIVSANRFGGIIRSVNNLGVATSNESVRGGADSKANTTFVLDGNKNLVETRSTGYVSTPGIVPAVNYADADVKFQGGTAFDNFVAFDPANPNYMSLGRWQGGTITADDLGNGAGIDHTVTLGPRSAHWAIAYLPPVGYVQGLTGTTTYTKIANTSPTDAAGNVGTLNSATLAANFAAQTVNAVVDLTIAAKTLTATATNLPITGHSFQGVFGSVTCSTACVYAGRLDGTFAGENAAGAGYGYDLWSGAGPYTDVIQGVVGFSGPPPAIAPKPAQNIATAYLHGGNTSATSFQASGTTYSLDGTGNLVQVAYDAALSESESQSITGGVAQPQGTTPPTAGGTVLTYGRWLGGTVSGTDFSGAFAGRAVDGAYHWIRGPATVPFLASMLTGTVNYTAQGGSVTDQAGVAGTLDLVNSTFSVNFTQQSLAVNIQATTGAGLWRGVGTGIRLEGSGQFFASTGSTSPHGNMAVELGGSTAGTFGTIDGTLAGSGVDAAGVSFAFRQGATNGAAGVVGFTGAAQSVPATTTGVVVAGMIGTPKNNAFPPVSTTGTTTLASLDSDLVNSVEGIVMASSRVSRDGAATPQVVKFDAEVPLAQPTGCTGVACTGVNHTPATFSLRDASFPLDTPPGVGAPALPTTLTNTGSEATTGITWGRYVGYVSYTDRITGTAGNPAFTPGAFDAQVSNWHGIWSPSQTVAPVLPATGTFAYTAIGGTNPTDSLGNVGTWSAATQTLSANFTAMTVNASLNAVVGPNTWAASAANRPIVNGTYFEAQKGGGANTLTVTCTGTCAGVTAGRMVGIFTGNAVAASPPAGTAGGAMVGVSLNAGGAAGVTMQNVTGFKK